MLGFVLIAENGEPLPDYNELEEVKWFTVDEALKIIKKQSIAETLLKSAIVEIKKL